jgi:beta-N-acetylhexosaminidase
MKDLSRFTLDEKVGQLFFLGFRGYEPDPDTRTLFTAIRPGGIVLSQRNISTFDQINFLTSSFVEDVDVPAFVAISQEGGAVDRLKQLFEPLPSMQDVASNGMTQVRFMARVIASQLESLGMNTSFGPVLDLAHPGSILRDRAIASSPGEVSRLAGAFIEGVSSRGIAVCPKHFPGLGGALRDPHFVLPRIDKPRKLLLQEDVQPFQFLVKKVPIIMVGHGFYPALMDERPSPACLSPRIVDGLLRRKLGFEGLIVTDDLTMGAVTSLGLTPDLFLEAFEAGNDMLLFSEATPLVEDAFRLIAKSARRSAALRYRIDQSVNRILAVKHSLGPPTRNHSQIRARVMRQIDRLSRTITVQSRRSAVAG